MSAVYLAGRGLASTLGASLPAALATLRAGGVAPTQRALPDGQTWPMHELPPDAFDRRLEWDAAARRLITAVVEQALPADPQKAAALRAGPMYIASSSLDIGRREAQGDFSGGWSVFGERIAQWLGWHGQVRLVSTACTSAFNALAAAAGGIRRGRTEHALVLGLELPNLFTLAGFAGMQLLAAERARPLAALRNGLVLGEAVAALHLRAAPTRWRLCAEANVVDGTDPTGAVPAAVVAMCRDVLARSGLRPDQIDLIKLQAAGSPGNDAIEIAALREVFGELPDWLTLKAALGHTLGASGAAELALLTACIETGVWPRLADAPAPSLALARGDRAPLAPRHVLATLIGFGGGHAAMVLEQQL